MSQKHSLLLTRKLILHTSGSSAARMLHGRRMSEGTRSAPWLGPLPGPLPPPQAGCWGTAATSSRPQLSLSTQPPAVRPWLPNYANVRSKLKHSDRCLHPHKRRLPIHKSPPFHFVRTSCAVYTSRHMWGSTLKETPQVASETCRRLRLLSGTLTLAGAQA